MAKTKEQIRKYWANQKKACPDYGVWCGMLYRCRNSRDKNYGGRGIAVCERWQGRGGYHRFIEDMGPRPSPSHTLDRIDNSKGYCPENCRWATPKEQNRNMRTNRFITFGGETKCVVDWAEEAGLRPWTLIRRLDRGWPMNKALITTSSRYERKVTNA